MELMTISQVSRGYGVTTRTLRYYEQVGLLNSVKVEDYAYRMYDEAALLRLEQILLLRKLRIPLEQIGRLLSSADASLAISVFRESTRELDAEISALSTIRTLLNQFIHTLESRANLKLRHVLFSDTVILDVINALTVKKVNFKEEKTMDDLSRADNQLSRLKDVRILHIPAYTVASSHYIGQEPERIAGEQLQRFVLESGLYHVKPDSRMFGFNHPSPSPDKEAYGYEMWVTIPEDMDVPAPLAKKTFAGGLYAAHMITMGAFHEWNDLMRWVTDDNPKYAPNDIQDGGECMGGLLEEHLNFVYDETAGDEAIEGRQIDLLFPVRLK